MVIKVGFRLTVHVGFVIIVIATTVAKEIDMRNRRITYIAQYSFYVAIYLLSSYCSSQVSHDPIQDTQIPAIRKPYRNQSLRDLTDQQILQYMKSGSELEQDQEVPARLPKDFWKLSPKDAALQLADLNRSDEHRKTYRLTIDDHDGKTPPKTCSIALRYYFGLSGYYGHFYLCCDPERSYFVTGSSQYHGHTGRTLSDQYFSYSLGWFDLPYTEAKQLADAIWWLNRIQSQGDNRGLEGWSGCSVMDSETDLRIFSVDSSEMIHLEENPSLSYHPIADCWEGDYDKAVLLSFVFYLVDSAWPEYVKVQHPGQSLTSGTYSENPKDNRDPEKQTLFQKNIHRVLDAFCEKPNPAMTDITTLAARCSGDDGTAEFSPLLHKVYPLLSRYEEKSDLDGSDTKEATQNDEQMRLEKPKKITVDELDTMARRGDLWAARKLKLADSARYLDFLESQLPGKNDWQSQHVFAELAEVNPQRARYYAMKLPKDFSGPLAISILNFLASPDVAGVPNEEAIVQSVMQTVQDKSLPGGGFRCRAIEALVPADNPLRFRSEKIDEMLLGLLKVSAKESDQEFILAGASMGLARRGQGKHLTQLIEVLKVNQDIYRFSFNEFLSVAVLASQSVPLEQRKPIQRL
jgi:hypothetical protein